MPTSSALLPDLMMSTGMPLPRRADPSGNISIPWMRLPGAQPARRYRSSSPGRIPGRYTTMTLDVREFIRRFLIHVLPKGFHRIRHYGLFASGNRAETIARARELLGLAAPAFEEAAEIDPATAQPIAQPCPC